MVNSFTKICSQIVNSFRSGPQLTHLDASVKFNRLPLRKDATSHFEEMRSMNPEICRRPPAPRLWRQLRPCLPGAHPPEREREGEIHR